MSLPTGARLGPYEILGPLGAGGMGEVYRARDTALDRDVALKTLPAEFSSDADRLARFEREAKTLASLNHPHIAQIYGLERSAGGVRAIVMELVEGEDLAERLRRGALPINEALNAARQVADALDVAHAAGVVHRDLKPGNVKIRPDGVVKVLDFGLAKLARDQNPERALSNSSTMTSPAMTGVGVILGTAAYMAPEQAKGRPVDKRADVWAFGCLLFEMLTAQRLFAADNVSETIAAVLTRDPQWTQLPDATPEPVRRLLRRCIVRDPRQRLPDIGVARLEIDDALSGADSTTAPRRLQRLWPVAIAAGLLGIAIGGAAAFNWLQADPQEVQQITAGATVTSPVLSPDAGSLAYVRNQLLVVRSLVTGEERELSETDGAANPFWSPDGTRIAYFRNGDLGWDLRVVTANGGPSRVVISSAQGMKDRPDPAVLWGGTWCPTGIVFVDQNPTRAMRVRSDTPGQELRSLDTPERTTLAYPHCLPDGRILAVRQAQNAESAAVVVVTPNEKEHVVLVELPMSNPTDVQWPVLVGSNVVFERADPTQGLWTFPVDAGLTRPTAAPRLVLQDASQPSTGAGRLTALTGVREGDRQLVWVDRDGKLRSPFGKPQREFMTPSLSPDETQVITGGRRAAVDGLWMHTEDTVAPWHDERGSWTAWSPDGARIAFVSEQRAELVVRSSPGGERVVITGGAFAPNWTHDSRSLVYSRRRNPTNSVWLVEALEGAKERRILPFENAREVSLSTDGKLIAYASGRSGRLEVYVTTRENPVETNPLSTDGGRYPRWTKTGELFFPCGPPAGGGPAENGAMCVATIDPRTGESQSTPRRLFEAAALGYRVITYGQRGYDVARDGTRVLVQKTGAKGTPAITLINNVESWLRRIPQ
jgi:Tol biopolymer transport system component